MLIHRPGRRRAAATSVEFACVAVLVFTLLFGVFEYARFLFVYHAATNAARDAARFAVVRTSGGVSITDADGTAISEPAVVTAADVAEVWRSGVFNGRAYGTGMCGMEGNISGYTVNVFAVPDASFYANPPDLTAAGKPAWTSAGFHQPIAVQVTGTYKPALPSLIGMSADVPFTVTVVMGSEAN